MQPDKRILSLQNNNITKGKSNFFLSLHIRNTEVRPSLLHCYLYHHTINSRWIHLDSVEVARLPTDVVGHDTQFDENVSWNVMTGTDKNISE